MGLGGLVTGIMGATGNSPKIGTPDSSKVGQDFAGLLQAYLDKQPNIYANEAKYQPLYNNLSLNNQTATRNRNITDAWTMEPRIRSVMRAYNPQATGLLDTLGQQAQEQLKTNGALDPATQRQVQQSVRSSQASRGLGYGPGDSVMEQFYQDQTEQQRRVQNQQFASGVATQSANYYGDPFSKMLGVSQPANVTPQIMSPNQTDSMLGTVYNANAAAKIGDANAQTAMLQGFNSFY